MSKKNDVAAILYDLPTNKISTDQIRWIMSNLPDTDEKGTSSETGSVIKFHHEEEELFASLGMTKEDVVALNQKLQESFPESDSDEEGSRKSVIIEKFYQKLDDKEKALLIAEGVPSFQMMATSLVVDTGGPEDLEKLIGGQIPPELKTTLIKQFELLKLLMRMKRKGE